ncbi:hypothetical protein ACQPYK_49445 (plasmid) [Streptosporangium sp. CA-135522]|uniref:hypothetical protein n=1 Tax=Streptosporangium sp. CA-135522 TaxID=3240072 RepID=UPI003D8A607E
MYLTRESAIESLKGLVSFLEEHPELPVPTHVVAIVPAEDADQITEALDHCDDARYGTHRVITLGENVASDPVWPMRFQTSPPGGFLSPAVLSDLEPAPRELPNCPPPPAQDGMGLFWDHYDNFAVTSHVEPDGSGHADKALHTCSRFGDYTGASVLVAVSADGRWQWRCVGCRAEISQFGLCSGCAEREHRLWGDPPF